MATPPAPVTVSVSSEHPRLSPWRGPSHAWDRAKHRTLCGRTLRWRSTPAVLRVDLIECESCRKALRRSG